ncbi:MAG: YgeY family selenium metabolism-linked hydrolase [Chloroflexi bacterium]|nr:YgeY family selenium metabolism-linked hydrolase [Chloroflexota bacterium]
MPDPAQTIRERVVKQHDEIINFFRDIVAIPSMESQIKQVGERIGAEMTRLKYDEVRFDRMGNILGRIGNGPRVLVYDSHIDTVSVGDPKNWPWDPFKGKVENGILYARGACDEKNSTPGMVYGLAMARDLGLLDGFTAYYFGNMEEACDGIAPHAFVEVDPKIRPDFVVIGEPTKMRIYRGHRGRVELKITSQGKSAHAAHHYLGDNAVYKLIDIIKGIQELDARLHTDPFLGKGTIAVTDAEVHTASINAVPERFVVYLDRRLTFGETRAEAYAQVFSLIPDNVFENIEVAELTYNTPSYTGFVFPVSKFYPSWAYPEDFPLVQVGQRTIEMLWGETRPTGKWGFSTNGTYWAGKAKIPAIGFGPGEEEWAHTMEEHITLDDVVHATEWYALFPKMLGESLATEK